jgi:hypothetical protein
MHAGQPETQKGSTHDARGFVRFAALALLAGTLAACGTSGPSERSPRVSRGPELPVNSLDPWGHHVREASAKYDVPEEWIRAVIEVESGGNTHLDGRPITSRAGAMGLMQIMPGTWAYLRRRHGFGDDPHDPRENILAGTAYLREMYDRFGAPGAFAAYNAGPGRLDDHLATGRPLPAETRNYVAMIHPATQDVSPRVRAVSYASIDVPRASPDRVRRVQAAARAGRDDGPLVAAAPRPVVTVDRSPSPAPAPRVQTASLPPLPEPGPIRLPPVPQPPAASAPAVFQPSPAAPPAPPAPAPRAASPVPAQVAAAPAAPRGMVPVPPPAAAVRQVSLPATPSAGAWGVQVGAFRTVAQAERAVSDANRMAGTTLRGARFSPTEVETNAGVLVRARLLGLDADAAVRACEEITAGGGACRVVRPDQV